MKKFVSFIFAFLLTHVLFSQDILTPMNSGKPVAQGNVGEFTLFPNGSSGYVLVYFRDGRISVKRSVGTTDNFISVVVSGSPVDFTGCRKLISINYDSNSQLVFFIASVNGFEGIYGLKVSGKGDISLLSTVSVTSSSFSGLISDFNVKYNGAGSAIISYIQGGSFGCTVIGQTLSSFINLDFGATEKVTSMSMLTNFRGTRLIQSGIYKCDNNTLYYFEIEKDTLLAHKKVLEGKEAVESARLSQFPEYSPILLYCEGGSLYGMAFQGNMNEVLNAGEPIAGNMPGAIREFTAFPFNKSFYTFYKTDNGLLAMCKMNSIDDVTPVNGHITFAGGISVDRLYYIPQASGNYIMGLRKDDASLSCIALQMYDKQSDTVSSYTPGILSGLNADRLVLFDILGYYFYCASIRNESGNYYIDLYSTDREFGNLVKIKTLSIGITDQCSVKYAADGLSLLTTGSGTYLFDLAAGKLGNIRCDDFIISEWIPGNIRSVLFKNNDDWYLAIAGMEVPR